MAEVSLILRKDNTAKVTFSGVAIGGVDLTADPTSFDITSIQDEDGTEITGETFPVPFAYIAASSGDFEAFIDAGAVFTAEKTYIIVCDLNDGADRVAHWEVDAVARVRDGVNVT